MKQGKNLIVVLLVALMLLTACGNNTVSQEPVNQPPVANDNNNLTKGEVGEAMLDHFKENKEISVGVHLKPFMLNKHEEMSFVPDLIENKPNMDTNLQLVFPEYDMVVVGAIGFVYVNAGDVSRLQTDSNFLAEKLMASNDLLYSLNSDRYANQVKAFTISSSKAKAILNIREFAAQAIREGKVNVQ